MQNLLKYFPQLSDEQTQLFEKLYHSFQYWNSRINVISRKDFHNFYLHHVLHSLAVTRIIQFEPGTRILDVGTGGGFPGIPLAIMFPQCHFLLVDSIRKKLKVIESIQEDFQLNNIHTLHTRIENYSEKYDFVVSRAVTQFPRFVSWVRDNIAQGGQQGWRNGIFYLKGGDIQGDLNKFKNSMMVYNIDAFFEEPFFDSKKILYLPIAD